MSDDPETKILEHAYDGIQEYDNPLPGWWRVSFAASIAFAIAYWTYFHVWHRGATPDETYRAELAEYDGKRALREARDAANVTETLLANNARDPKIVERGAAIFTQRCASCHGDHAQGLIGPNLTDLNQIHGTARLDIYKTVSRGAPGTAMIAWSEQMPPADVVAAATFVTTLRGHLVAGKEPQGTPVTPFEP